MATFHLLLLPLLRCLLLLLILPFYIPYERFSLFSNSTSPAVLQALEKNDDGCCQFALLWLVEKNEIHHCAQRSMDTDIAGTGYKRDLTRTANCR